MNKKLDKAVKKLTNAYRAWIIAGAEYNSLVHEMTGVTDSSYNIAFDTTDAKKIFAKAWMKNS